MATHDYVIDNQSAPAFRTDLNNVLQAILTQNSSATAPATATANMIWYDTTNKQLKKRNEAGSAWITLGTINEALGTFTSSGMPPIANAQYFTAFGTWTKPAGLKAVLVTVVGGGGGGGFSGNTTLLTGGGGGGGGGASIKYILAASLGATETVTIGAGGAASGAGGTSSFGTHASATGGQPGGSSTLNSSSTNHNGGGAGGLGSSGNLNIRGGGGEFGFCMSTTGATGGFGGSGGCSILGGGGQGVFSINTEVNGIAGGAFGGGGSGAASRTGTGAKSGGTGGAGVVIVQEIF